jgi:hypothetical protein
MPRSGPPWPSPSWATRPRLGALHAAQSRPSRQHSPANRHLQSRALRRRGGCLRRRAAHRPGRLDLVHRFRRLDVPVADRNPAGREPLEGDQLRFSKPPICQKLDAPARSTTATGKPCITSPSPGSISADSRPSVPFLPKRDRGLRRRLARLVGSVLDLFTSFFHVLAEPLGRITANSDRAQECRDQEQENEPLSQGVVMRMSIH